jgi:hypothetical protein
MTKKDFILLTNALYNLNPKLNPHQTTWEVAVNTIAEMCKKHNPRFNLTKFLEECGYETHR